jgi:hypothetical protein
MNLGEVFPLSETRTIFIVQNIARIVALSRGLFTLGALSLGFQQDLS